MNKAFAILEHEVRQLWSNDKYATYLKLLRSVQFYALVFIVDAQAEYIQFTCVWNSFKYIIDDRHTFEQLIAIKVA